VASVRARVMRRLDAALVATTAGIKLADEVEDDEED
jgi:hypothetical protein